MEPRELSPDTPHPPPPGQPLVVNVPLHRAGGSVLRFYPNFLPPHSEEKTELQATMLNCRLYRQYYWQGGIKEPRVHVLLSNNASTPNNGYTYHGVRMRALPMSAVPVFEKAATKYANLFHLPDRTWNIGCDLICYRNGCDSVGWHADDTHSETVVLCVVVESAGDRPVHIKPNEKVSPLADGDEEVELYVAEGDAYELDFNCQRGYLHRLPKKEKETARRMVAIFRHGEPKSVYADTGRPLDVEEYYKKGLLLREMAEEVEKVGLDSSDVADDDDADDDDVNDDADDKEDGDDTDDDDENDDEQEFRINETILPEASRDKTVFGHIPGIAEGLLYSRQQMFLQRAHSSDQRGVSGNMGDGADAIVVARNDPNVREKDGFVWLRYSSARKQGGGALTTTFVMKKAVRVFRSSAVTNSLFAPINPKQRRTSSHLAATYRYDGLFYIHRVINHDGQDTTEAPPIETPDVLYHNTIFLRRCPKRPLDIEEEVEGEFYNEMSDEELWDVVQENQGKPVEERGNIPWVDGEADMIMLAHKEPSGSAGVIMDLLGDLMSTIEYRDEAETATETRKNFGKDVEGWYKQRRKEWRQDRLERRMIKTEVAHGSGVGGREGGIMETSTLADKVQVAYCLEDSVMRAIEERHDIAQRALDEAREQREREEAAKAAAQAVVDILQRGKQTVQDSYAREGLKVFRTDPLGWLSQKKLVWRQARLEKKFKEGAWRVMMNRGGKLDHLLTRTTENPDAPPVVGGGEMTTEAAAEINAVVAEIMRKEREEKESKKPRIMSVPENFDAEVHVPAPAPAPVVSVVEQHKLTPLLASLLEDESGGEVKQKSAGAPKKGVIATEEANREEREELKSSDPGFTAVQVVCSGVLQKGVGLFEASDDFFDEDAEWVQCCDEDCLRWHKVGKSINTELLPNFWYCAMNTWGGVEEVCRGETQNKTVQLGEDQVIELKQAQKQAEAAAYEGGGKKPKKKKSGIDVGVWVQCSNKVCGRWHLLAPEMSAEDVGEIFYCEYNEWEWGVVPCRKAPSNATARAVVSPSPKKKQKKEKSEKEKPADLQCPEVGERFNLRWKIGRCQWTINECEVTRRNARNGFVVLAVEDVDEPVKLELTEFWAMVEKEEEKKEDKAEEGIVVEGKRKRKAKQKLMLGF
jgi:hypothetical protein